MLGYDKNRWPRFQRLYNTRTEQLLPLLCSTVYSTAVIAVHVCCILHNSSLKGMKRRCVLHLAPASPAFTPVVYERRQPTTRYTRSLDTWHAFNCFVVSLNRGHYRGHHTHGPLTRTNRRSFAQHSRSSSEEHCVVIRTI